MSKDKSKARTLKRAGVVAIVLAILAGSLGTSAPASAQYCAAWEYQYVYVYVCNGWVCAYEWRWQWVCVG